IIENTVSQIERQYGSGAIMKLGDKSSILDIGYISTNSLELDIALGIGEGRIQA
ncbi:unnamed protein product, partial [marine sediment metagenome]